MKKILFFVIFCLSLGFIVFAKEAVSEDKSKDSNLPRFVSLRSSPVNARSGPGVKYPIEWVYMQQSAPGEVIAEYEDWRRVKDWQGSESWIKSQMLKSKRFIRINTPGENNLYSKSNFNSQVVARVEDGVVAEVKKCPAKNDFCLIKIDNFEGWMPKQNIYGLYKDEVIN